MSSYPKKRINFSELDDHFDDDQQIDSLRYNAEIDSAIQIKKSSDHEKLNEVQQLLQFSPHPQQENQKLSSVRCSFGLNSNNNFNPTRLPFSQNQNSVNSSIQIGSPDTASFPLQKKFLKLYQMRSSIEEISAENDLSQSRENMTKNSNHTLNTEEDKNVQFNQDENLQNELYQNDSYALFTQLLEQLEQSQNQLQKQQLQYQELQSKYEKQQSQIIYLTKLNQEITKTLDETQNQLQLLNETNGLLKKKIQSYKQYSITEQSQYNGNTNRYNKENNDYLKHHNSTESNQSIELVNNLKKTQKVTNTYSNVIMMLLLMIQKCFYLDESIDKEGKEVINKITQQINQRQLDNIVFTIESLIKYFEQRFSDMATKNSKVQSMNNWLIKEVIDIINSQFLYILLIQIKLQNMGQSCQMQHQTIDQNEIQYKLVLIKPISHRNQIKRPIFEINQINSREETMDEINELDVDTRKSQKLTNSCAQQFQSSFQFGVQQQKQIIKNQIKSFGGDISQIFNKKKQKLNLKTYEESKEEQINRESNRNATFNCARNCETSQSPLQQWIKNQSPTYESLKSEIKSIRSINGLNQEQHKAGILREKKVKAKSLYYKRTVRFQC
ncbi:unnamed protein product [Paramecium octaurelia]|uniref:Uncharacterized protein n=1 Tax=Paramecium octaurelia TaxID=43137 RepID=A0A8S1WNQ8_PAROT|nr:unnamed protein product [Paramecium octaurelia]